MLSGDNKDSNESELGRLLQLVSKRGLKALDIPDLDSLRTLLEAKTYTDKKAIKSKEKLLKQINKAFYDRHNPRRFL